MRYPRNAVLKEWRLVEKTVDYKVTAYSSALVILVAQWRDAQEPGVWHARLRGMAWRQFKRWRPGEPRLRAWHAHICQEMGPAFACGRF